MGLVVLGGLGAWYVVFLPRVVDVSYLRLLAPPLASLGAAAAAGLSVLVLNPDLLYLQATPMTEPLLLALTTMSVWMLVKWTATGGQASQ